jgi:hypothetical protein
LNAIFNNKDDQIILSNNGSPLLSNCNRQSDSNNYKSSCSSSLAGKSNANVVYVTPATDTCSSASSSIGQCLNKLDTEAASSSASVYSSAVATYSRSSSMNSLTSFDVKSTHSSIPSCSEYSATGTNPFKNMQNNEDMYSTKYQGCVTPTAYSELPSSPGELFPHQYTLVNQNGANVYFVTNVNVKSVNSR